MFKASSKKGRNCVFKSAQSLDDRSVFHSTSLDWYRVSRVQTGFNHKGTASNFSTLLLPPTSTQPSHPRCRWYGLGSCFYLTANSLKALIVHVCTSPRPLSLTSIASRQHSSTTCTYSSISPPDLTTFWIRTKFILANNPQKASRWVYNSYW